MNDHRCLIYKKNRSISPYPRVLVLSHKHVDEKYVSRTSIAQPMLQSMHGQDI